MNYLPQFETYLLKVRGYSERTIKTYIFNCNEFSRWCKENYFSPSLSSSIKEFIMSLMERELTPSTVNNYISSIKSYYNFECTYHGLRLNPAAAIRDVRQPKRLPRYITENTMSTIIDSLGDSSFKKVRSKAIILLLYSTGIRCHELSSLDFNDIDFNNNTIRVIGKRNKERILPITEDVTNTVWNMYYSVQHVDSSLFCSVRGERLTDKQIRLIVKHVLCQYVPNELAHPHVLRHTFATHMMNGGASIEHVRLFLGHASCTTTAIYQHTAINFLRNIYNKTFAR